MNKLIVFSIGLIGLNLYSINYWDNQFSSEVYTTVEKTISMLDHHITQNNEISNDFLAQTRSNESDKKGFFNALKNSVSLLEVGCGSGEMLQILSVAFPEMQMLGLDVSSKGIEYACSKNKKSNISYRTFNCLENNLYSSFGKFDIGICSNCLEHFKNPFVLLDNILEACLQCIILVPYKQPLTDGYDIEGGIGHVYTFDEESFKDYTVLSLFTFKTSGWQYSSCGETPLQLAVLLTKK